MNTVDELIRAKSSKSHKNLLQNLLEMAPWIESKAFWESCPSSPRVLEGNQNLARLNPTHRLVDDSNHLHPCMRVHEVRSGDACPFRELALEEIHVHHLVEMRRGTKSRDSGKFWHPVHLTLVTPELFAEFDCAHSYVE